MSKKILTALAPVAAIVAFMALPALAQATQAQCGAKECLTGAKIVGQSTNLVTKTQNPTGELKCTGSVFQAELQANQTETLDGHITSDTLTGCTANGISADIKTNASTTAPWQLQVQQPEPTGQVTAHLDPASGSSLKFTVQVQVFGFSVATCTYSASNIQLMGTQQEDTMHVEGNEQFTLVESNSSECGTVNTTKGDLTGEFQIETDVEINPLPVVVHMS